LSRSIEGPTPSVNGLKRAGSASPAPDTETWVPPCLPVVSRFWRRGSGEPQPTTLALVLALSYPETELGAPCLPVLETWETANLTHPLLPLFLPFLTQTQNWVPHVSRCWRRGKPPTSPTRCCPCFYPFLPRHRTGCPMSPGVGDVGNRQPHPPAVALVFALSYPDTELGAPCLPVLETWETATHNPPFWTPVENLSIGKNENSL